MPTRRRQNRLRDKPDLIVHFGTLAADHTANVRHDVAELQRIIERLFHWAAIVESSGDAIIGKDPQGIITSWNPAAEAMYGYTGHEAIGQPVTMLFPPDRQDEFHHIMAQLTRGERISNFETVRVRKDGTRIDVLVTISPIMDLTGTVIGASTIARDLTERKLFEADLRHQALHDYLTGLPNRNLLQDRLAQGILFAERAQTTLALYLLDMDRFKDVNGTFGHHHGDLLLQHLAERLLGVVNATDTVARLGGDEFAVLAHIDDARAAIAMATALHDALELPFEVEEHALRVQVSLGVALYPEHGRTPDTLLRQAEVALQSAKHGDHPYMVYAPELDVQRQTRLALTSGLRQACLSDDFVLHYQPVIDLASGQVSHVEALVRWPHPVRGLLRPDDFVPLAEETGLIGALTASVLRLALRQSRDWQQRRMHLAVAVNLSTLNLRDAQIVDTILNLLDTYAVPPARLYVELTETALMRDQVRALDVLTRLSQAGVRIAVDDFGTGYSSLAYLTRLPVDDLKIDRSFVQRITEHEADAIVVSSTIGLGRSLGLRVVAEGAENQETWEMLVGLGCDAVQGYHISRPLPAPDLERWLQQHAP